MECNSVNEVWEKTSKQLEVTLSKDVYDRWISIIHPETMDEETVTLSVANDFYQTWLEENYLSLICDSLSSSTGLIRDIKFKVSNETSSSREVKAEPASAKPAAPVKKRSRSSSAREFHLNSKYSFDSFIVGSSNNFAHAAAMAVAQAPAKAYNPLFLYGGVGLGKTHLMQAIGNYVVERKKSNICYISCEAFTNDYIDALQRKKLVDFRKKYRGTDLLLIDDIQFLAGKERMQEEFFHTFNALFDSHKQIVMTCDRPASDIPSLEHRLVSRFEWGLVTEVEVPDVETRIAILRNKKERMNLTLSDEIITFIAENIRSNIRRLEGALIRAASYSSLTGRELSIETLENLLRDTLDQAQSTPITVEEIQRAVAEYYDIRLGDMTSRKRPQNIARPRQVAMYLCRRETGQSLPSIGNAFARNHATVLHACRQIEKHMDSDKQLKQAVMNISRQIAAV